MVAAAYIHITCSGMVAAAYLCVIYANNILVSFCFCPNGQTRLSGNSLLEMTSQLWCIVCWIIHGEDKFDKHPAKFLSFFNVLDPV
jgi:hypothetical protein